MYDQNNKRQLTSLRLQILQIMIYDWDLIKGLKTSLNQIIGPGMEKRKYPRLEVDLPMAYLIHSPDSGKSSAGMAVLKNISQGGMFFKCPPPLPIGDGDIRDFTIDTIPIMRHISRFSALGKVVRLEPPEENYFDFGIAVQFHSDLNIEFRR